MGHCKKFWRVGDGYGPWAAGICMHSFDGQIDGRTERSFFVHGGQIFHYAEADGHQLADIYDFSANLNPLGPPQCVWQAVQAALPLITHYPDWQQTRVTTVIAEHFQVQRESVICGNGASEVLHLAFQALRPKRTFIFTPAFSEYAACATRVHSRVVELPMLQTATASSTARFQLPMADCEAELHPGDVVVLNTPHNPSGQHFAKSTWLQTVLQWAEAGVYVLIDESFLDFLENAADESTVTEAATHPYLVTIRSATKIFAIPGLRFGFATAHPEVIEKMHAERDGWTVNTIAAYAAEAAYQPSRDIDAFLAETHTWLRAAKHQVSALWPSDSRIQCMDGDVNFFLAQFQTSEQCRKLQQLLAKRGHYVRDCSHFSNLGNQYIRVALRHLSDNQRLWTNIAECLDASGQF
jgi:threonine-phosphate decarboxylase